MKVLQVNEHYAPVGGAEQYINNVSAHLERRGITVAVLYAVQTAQDFQVPGREEVHLAWLLKESGFNQSKRFQRIRQVIEDLNPDVIQVHNLYEPDVLALLTELRPTIQFVHTQSFRVCPGEGKFYKRTHEICYRPFGPYCLIAPYLHRCASQRPWRIASHYVRVRGWLNVAPRLEKLMVASRYMRLELIAVGIATDHIVVNPIGVEMEAGSESSSRTPQDAPTVLFVGRMYELKGPQYLLAALEQLDVPCHVVFVGDGADVERLKQAAGQLSPRHTVEFTGWIGQDEVQRYYQQARVVVVPSVWPEPFGMVGVEALKYGKPVVAFDVGGVSDWLKDGDNGFLVAPKDTSGLAAAIKRILVSPELADAMGRHAQALAVAQFNIERHIDTLLGVYEGAVNEPPRRQERPDAKNLLAFWR
ncbi:MAG: glycosyltransferase family 4 protein [Acidobacteria bacterium]|nr:glycosyltransferase family 4 protein [Acidobacteriota bacterium]